MGRFFDPPAPKPLIDKNKIPSTYKSMRFKVFMGAFLGYAGYYLVRKNLSLAAPGMIADGLINAAQVGIAMSAVSIAYAFSKFIMGSVSDRSDARKFLCVGLILSAIAMIATGIIPYSPSNQILNMIIIFVMMLIVGWLSGMGWPPCGRIMAHWFSQNERSFKMSLWNTSHNVGSGAVGNLATAGTAMILALGLGMQTWRGAFILPSLVAILVAVACWWLIRDTPQSCGLPSINDYRNDRSGVKTDLGDNEKIPLKTLFVDYVFKNKYLWIIAFANIFVYLVRYGFADWAPTYLQADGVNLMTEKESNAIYAWHNYAGILGTIFCGWISSLFFKGRCAPPNVIFMILVLIGCVMYWKAGEMAAVFVNPADDSSYATLTKWILSIGLIDIGFFVYGPVALIGIQALNLVPKNAAGTAAGFVGLFGYLFGDAILSKIAIGGIIQKFGWDASLMVMTVGCVLAIILCALPWKAEKNLTVD